MEFDHVVLTAISYICILCSFKSCEDIRPEALPVYPVASAVKGCAVLS
jgi:hypothetical protein